MFLLPTLGRVSRERVLFSALPEHDCDLTKKEIDKHMCLVRDI